MTGRRRSSLAVAGTLVLLAGCGGGDSLDPQPEQPAQPAPRTTWALRHRVVESDGLHIISSGLSAYEEWTGVSLRQDRGESCYVSVFAPGQGGPDNKAGQKVATTFRGQQALREDAGAEGPYLMWQIQAGSWLEVSCDDDASTDRVAAAVRLTRSSVALPFAITSLPKAYEVAQLMQDCARGTTDVYVGRVEPQIGLPDSDLQVSLLSEDERSELSGRAVIVAGLPAVLSEKPTSPRVCVSVQSRHVSSASPPATRAPTRTGRPGSRHCWPSPRSCATPTTCPSVRPGSPRRTPSAEECRPRAARSGRLRGR